MIKRSMTKPMTNMQGMTTIKTYIKTGVICFGFLILIGCQSETELSAEQIVERAIESHGGLEKWDKVKQISFDKSVTLFNEDGAIQIKTEQFQLFRLQPKLFAKLEWEQDGKDMQIIYEDEKVSKTINDSIVTDPDELKRAENAVFAAQYVICQPFDLLQSDSELTLMDKIPIEGKEHQVVKVVYKGDTVDADQWYYIIDPETYNVVANQVILTDHTSWIENLSYDTSTDFKFNLHRKSYRLNELGEKTYLRAEYFYTDFDVIYK